MKLTGAYFSPTGGTKRAVELLCGFLGQGDLLDLGGRTRVEAQFEMDELLVLGVPVYAGRIPAVPGLLDGLTGKNTPCVLIAAYGNRHYDDALAQAKELVEKRDFRCVAAAAIITPHVFAPTLGAGRPDEEDLAVMEQFSRQILEKLKQPCWTEAQVPGNPEPALRPAAPVAKDRDWDICLGCGACAGRCPTGAMDTKTLLWDQNKCISCMACVSVCPVGAMGFNSSTLAQRLTEKFSERRPIEVFLNGEGR